MSNMTIAQAIQQNLQARQALLSSSPRFVKDLGITTGALGGSTRIKLYNVGVITSLLLEVTASITIGTAIATQSPQGPFNLISRIRLTDFDGTDRVNCTGAELFALNCARSQEYWGYNNSAAAPSVLTSPQVPTAVAAGQAFSFFLRVPLAYNPANDLRGSIMAQVNTGELYLTIDWNSAFYGNANADFPYNGAGTTTVALASGGLNAQVWQEYLQPQAIGNSVPLPSLDLLTVYEIAGNLKSNDNLAANTEKLVNMPNVRSIIGAYLYYVNNGIMNANGSDVARMRVLANGNNVLYEATPRAHLTRWRDWCNADMRNSMYPFMFRDKPIETSLYGNVQIGFTPSTVNAGNTYIGIMTESFYTRGTTLPGLSQG